MAWPGQKKQKGGIRRPNFRRRKKGSRGKKKCPPCSRTVEGGRGSRSRRWARLKGMIQRRKKGGTPGVVVLKQGGGRMVAVDEIMKEEKGGGGTP